jgi:hypothetical protein
MNSFLWIRSAARALVSSFAAVLALLTLSNAQHASAQPAPPQPDATATVAPAAQPAPPPAPVQEPPPPPPPPPAADEPEDKPAAWYDKIKLSGFIQAQYIANEASGDGVDSQGRPENLDRFEVRRARLKLTYTDDPAEGVLHIDALPSGFRVLEAEVSGKLKWEGDAYTKLTAGLFRYPFGWELQESMSVHPFPERSLWANRLFPGVRDIGARVWGAAWNDALIYQVALVNGNPIGDSVFPGLDPNGFKDVVGRIGTKLGGLRAGVSGLIGKGYLPPVEDDATTDDVDEAHGPIDYSRWAAGIDVVLALPVPSLGELGLYAEAVYAKNLDRANARFLPQIVFVDDDGVEVATDDVTSANQLGWYVGALQHLGELFAAGARFDYFDHDVEQDDDQTTALTLVAHAYPAAPLRLTIAYEFRFEEPSVDDNQLWLRAQVKY